MQEIENLEFDAFPESPTPRATKSVVAKTADALVRVVRQGLDVLDAGPQFAVVLSFVASTLIVVPKVDERSADGTDGTRVSRQRSHRAVASPKLLESAAFVSRAFAPAGPESEIADPDYGF
jgi:hypothetical protein